MKRGLLLGILLIIGICAKAQFSGDPETFLKDIKKYLGSSNRSKTKDFMDVFEPNWLNNFSPEYQRKVVSTSNLIVAKRLPPFPELYGYLLSVHSFVLTDQPEESFNSWHETIDALLDSKKVKKFRDFIEICADFFSEGMIYYSTNHIWKVRGGSYVFQFEKNNPTITFENVDLQCYAVNRKAGKKDNPYFDSTIVRNTSGLFEPFRNKWTGSGGIIDWQKVGMDPKTNYAEVADYMMSLKGSKVESDSVLVHTEYYEKPLYGSLKDIAKKINREVDRVYPQFISYNKHVVRKDILPEVDYVGGFSLEGADFSGIGYDSEPAQLVFYKEGEPFVLARSLRIKANQKGISSDECEVTMYISENDSIFHPGLQLSYDTELMQMARSKEGVAQAPFKDSYHQLDMYVDRILWTRNDPNLTLTWHPLSSRKLARFESQDFFDLKVYNELQGMSQVNPLVAIYGYAYKYDLTVIPLNKVASAMHYTNEQAIPIVLDLANQGFINYNKSKQTITLQPKTKKYIDARAGRRDYDHISFVSNLLEVKKKQEINPDGTPNKRAISYNTMADSLNRRKSLVTEFGRMNIKSLDFTLNEVDPIKVSPAKNVVVFPDAGNLLVKEGRDFLFSGAVMAGKLEAYVDDGAFDYENFKVHLLEVDAALFRVAPIFGGSDRLIPMYSHFSQLKGSIQIDDPSNRSGEKKEFGHLPQLKASQDCYVYYNHPAIYEGVYDSSDFYFKVDPFEFDSLNTFDEATMKFSGEMRSAGIFPVFEEEISLQEDYSFGFKTQAPPTGFDFYGEDAKFDNEIRLSNKGLRGAGEINFVTSNSVSEDFVFFPDSTMGISQYVNTPQTKNEGISVPDVSGKDVLVTYVPKDKKLKVRTTKNPLLFFEEEATMKGMTELTEEGMTGRGLIYFKEAELGSKDFDFKRWVIDADTSDFNLLAKKQEGEEVDVQNPLSFDSRNLNAHVDFEARKGEFKSNDGTSIVNFPKNQYICYIDMFTWLMDQDEMELSSNETSDIAIESGLDLAGSNFYSVHPDQDSLNFKAPKAKFYLKDNVIECEKVTYLDVADARIFPEDEQVIIRKKAKMDPFENAEIVANFITKYHKITEATVQVLARRSYEASGNYPYKDSQGNVQVINFANIGLDSAYQTVAKGMIAEDAGFKLSEQFDFYGGVELYASDEFLTFNGATRINHECNQFARNWLSFRAPIDPENIQIPVGAENLKDLEGNGIAIGLVKRNTQNSDSLEIYPAFLSALENPDDHIMFTTSGVLNYNEASKEFRIASPEKLINRAENGNYLALHIESCSMEGDGLVDLGVELPGVELETYGVVNYNAANKLTSMNLSGALSFYMDKKALEIIAEDIKSTEGLSGIDIGRTTLEQAVSEQISKEEAENLKADYTLDGEVKKLPKEMQQTFYLSNLKLTWSPDDIALVSNPITAIVAINGEPVFKDFTVKLAIQYTVPGGLRGDKLGLMIELPGGEKPGNYYYFAMNRVKKNTEMDVMTSNKELENLLLELGDDKRKEKDFQYALRTKNKGTYLSIFRGLFGE